MKKKKIITYIIFILSLIGVIYFVIDRLLYKIDETNIKKQITVASESVTITEVKEIENDNIEIVNNNNDNIKEKLINADLKELKKINSDVKGWIKVNGTNIDYPFVQTSNNDYYLKHSLNKSYNRSGWVFLDYRNNSNTINNKNTIIYAHNTRNTTMFGTLKKTLSNNWLNNSKNHIIKISNDKENTLWKVFSIYHIPVTSDYLKVSFKNDDEFLIFANTLLERSLHDFNTTINSEDIILTLSTCYNNKERLVLHAKLIKREAK